MAKKINLKKDETKVMVTCPKCGGQIEVAIPNKEQFMAGMAIGKDSGLGTIFLPTVSQAQKKRMEELQKSGVTFEQTITIKNKDGKTVDVKMNHLGDLNLSDPVIKSIINGGNLYDPHIAKQHVTAMMLKMLTRKCYYFGSPQKDRRGRYDLSHFHNNMLQAGYEYTWRVLRDKLNEQVHMKKNGDITALAEDSMFYNKDLAVAMFDDYMTQLVTIFNTARVHRCKHRQYIKFLYATKLGCSYKGVFLSEMPNILDTLKELGIQIRKAGNIEDLYDAVSKFVEVAPRLRLAPGETKKGEFKFTAHQCKEWQDAYKGYGAFFTMKNLILYHDCKIRIADGLKCITLNETESIAQLREWAQSQDGYWLLGALKGFLEYNNFDIAAKQEEWRKAKRG